VRGARTCIASLLAVAALAGCGSDDEQPGLTAGQSRALIAQLEAARERAAARDVGGTRTALARFRQSVVRLRRSGALSDETARQLRIGAARVLDRVESDSTPPAQPVQPATPPPKPDKHEKKHEKEHGKKGKKH
jgi:hypothetical protein